jgi:hypothetical protein
MTEKELKENFVPLCMWTALEKLLIDKIHEDKIYANLYYDMKFARKAWMYGYSYIDNCLSEYLKHMKTEAGLSHQGERK